MGVGHVLLLPEALAQRPQVLTEGAVRKALAFQLASRLGGGSRSGGAAVEENPGSFRVGFNGLGAHASLNHLHFQAWYSRELDAAGVEAGKKEAMAQPAAFAVERVPTLALGRWEEGRGGDGGDGGEDGSERGACRITLRQLDSTAYPSRAFVVQAIPRT